MKENVIASLQFPQRPSSLPYITVGELLEQRVVVVRQLDVRYEKVHPVTLGGWGVT
jgi:hypothetical protein